MLIHVIDKKWHLNRPCKTAVTILGQQLIFTNDVSNKICLKDVERVESIFQRIFIIAHGKTGGQR